MSKQQMNEEKVRDMEENKADPRENPSAEAEKDENAEPAVPGNQDSQDKGDSVSDSKKTEKSSKEKQLKKRIAELEKELEAARQQRDSWEEKAKAAEKERVYQQADLDNFKRRQQERLYRQVDEAKMEILRGLVDLDDNVRLASRTVEQADNLEGCKEGIRMLSRKFATFLQSHGIEHMESHGNGFDPAVHEAVMMVEEGDHYGQIVQDVIQEGYMFNGNVLRMAKVKVAQGSGEAPPEDGMPESEEG